MAYDLHIVRTKDRTQAASAPITKKDVDALIASDCELDWSTTDYVDMADATGASMRYYMITWRNEPCFWWYRDEIRCSGPDEAQVLKLVQMAQALNAYAVGDEGEIYPIETTIPSLAPSSPQVVQKPWWRFW
jgi:hypothetical protein